MDCSNRVANITDKATAASSRDAYAKDLKYFSAWAAVALGWKEVDFPISGDVMEQFVIDHVEGLSPEIDAALMASGAKRTAGRHRVDTIARRVKGIGWQHKTMGLNSEHCRSDTIRNTLNAARRLEASAGVTSGKKRAITKPMLDRMLRTFGKTLRDKRDMAILVFGFFTGGRRRSEIAGAKVENLELIRGGYTYLLHISKTDQEGRGALKMLRSPHAKYLTAWLKAGNIEAGYLFRRLERDGTVSDDPISDATVWRIVKERIDSIGLDPARYGAHSLRRGFLTECGRRPDVPIEAAMQCSGHRDIRTAYRYYEEGRLSQNPATRL